MRARFRSTLLAAWGALAVIGITLVPPVSAKDASTDPRLAFNVTDGPNLNSFLQAGPVAAHVVLRAGTEARIVIAFPAGDSGVGVWFAATREPVTWALDEQPAPITLKDDKGRLLYGIQMQATATAPELSIKQVLLSSVRVFRDYQIFGTIPPEVKAVPDEQPQTLVWQRDRLDGAPGYRLSIEVTHGEMRNGHIVAGPDGTIGMKVTALSGDKPLTPLSPAEILINPAQADPAALNVLTFLSYKEKLLAGSWRYNTYFGRDTLMSIRLLLPVLAREAAEDGIGSVLSRLSSTGEVAHEEEIGEFALLNHLRTDRSLSDTPIFDYKMIDGTFMLAPTAEAWLLQNPRASVGAVAFLARKDGGYGGTARTFGADLVTNLRFVIRSAQAFADQPQAAHLISLKPGFIWGQWRDSDNGLSYGRYPYDVNAVFVPAALTAASRLYASGLLNPYLSGNDRILLSRAADMANVWRAQAAAFFSVEVANETARSQIGAYARSVGVLPDVALRSLDTAPVTFHAVALDADTKPIPILNSDEGFDLLFGNPSVESLDMAITSVLRPFPAGLMTGVGMVVANPVFASLPIQALFSKDAYHGTVIWSWQQAVFAAGLARQLERKDLPDPLRERLLTAQRELWRAIDAGKQVINSELWSWSYRNGHYAVAPFGTSRSDSDESNAAQLWSTVYLAIHSPDASRP